MTKQLFVCLTLIFIGVSCDQAPSSSSNPAAPKAETPPLTASAPVYDPVQKWGKQKVASAKEVMALANQDCQIYEEGPHLVVEMRMYITDPNKRLGYVKAIADSDVILHGQPRNIYFYDPSNKKIAQADTLHGVRLIDLNFTLCLTPSSTWSQPALAAFILQSFWNPRLQSASGRRSCRLTSSAG